MINIIITSDIRIYCEGLGQILASNPDVNVKGIVDNYESAITLITATLPEIVLLDMTMAGSCQLAAAVTQISPRTKIVALAVSYDESNIMQCAEAGVTCYIPREASVSQLIEAIVEAAKGECYCPPKIAACLLKKVQHLAHSAKRKYMFTTGSDQLSDNEPCDLQARLTQRERQIAGLLNEGLSNKQIARRLSIEVSTVKNHVHNVLVKLEVQNRSQAVFLLQKVATPRLSESIDLDQYLELSS
ncbi:MAG: response regulator transcription factor [Gammaproteobacteria bacterium]|nr:response regulator transcription factor [Gammaproteobacteria bacterium]